MTPCSSSSTTRAPELTFEEWLASLKVDGATEVDADAAEILREIREHGERCLNMSSREVAPTTGNPFEPTFGRTPPLLVGRDTAIADVAESVERAGGAALVSA